MDVGADPVAVLWAHMGSPVVDQPWRASSRPCSRCFRAAEVAVRVADVVSSNFTGWDEYANGDRSPVWCPPCTWAHTTPSLRTRPLAISSAAESGEAGPALLRSLLGRPLSPQEAVVVPLSRKKHLLPRARWGLLTTDEVTLRWGAAEVERLEVLVTLRAAGYSEAALAAPAPRYEHLRTQAPRAQAEALSTWSLLDAWRAYPPLLAVALRATRPVRDADDATSEAATPAAGPASRQAVSA